MISKKLDRILNKKVGDLTLDELKTFLIHFGLMKSKGKLEVRFVVKAAKKS